MILSGGIMKKTVPELLDTEFFANKKFFATIWSKKSLYLLARQIVTLFLLCHVICPAPSHLFTSRNIKY